MNKKLINPLVCWHIYQKNKAGVEVCALCDKPEPKKEKENNDEGQ